MKTYTQADMVNMVRQATMFDSTVDVEAVANDCYDACGSWNPNDVDPQMFWGSVEAHIRN